MHRVHSESTAHTLWPLPRCQLDPLPIWPPLRSRRVIVLAGPPRCTLDQSWIDGSDKRVLHPPLLHPLNPDPRPPALALTTPPAVPDTTKGYVACTIQVHPSAPCHFHLLDIHHHLIAPFIVVPSTLTTPPSPFTVSDPDHAATASAARTHPPIIHQPSFPFLPLPVPISLCQLSRRTLQPVNPLLLLKCLCYLASPPSRQPRLPAPSRRAWLTLPAWRMEWDHMPRPQTARS